MSSPATVLEKIPAKSWGILLLLAAAGIMFYLDRQTFAILKTTISEDLDLSSTDFAVLLNAYMIPYVICYIFSGITVDRLGTRFAGTAFLISMAIATFWCAIAQTMGQLVGARALLGIGESGISPASIVMLTLWFPASRRAFAMTTCQSIQVLGPILAPPLVASLALNENVHAALRLPEIMSGWRAAFLLPAILSAVVAVLWFSFDRKRPFQRTVEPFPVARLEKGTFLRVLKWRPLRGLILARIICDPFYFFIIYWQVGFLQEQAGWTLAEVGKYGWIPYVFVMIANVLMGLWSDRQGRRESSVVIARAKTLGLLACLAPCAILTPFVAGNGFLVLTMLTLLYFMANCWIQISGVMVSELAPPGTVATAIGILSALSGVAAIGFTQIAGVLVDKFNYTPLFIFGAFLHPLAAFILWFCYVRGKSSSAAPTVPAAA